MKKRALFNSIIALILCVAMLAGSTFAWFTDSSVSTGNIIQSGNLDIEMYWAEDLSGGWNNVEDSAKNKIFDYEYWEPGYTQVRYIRIVNAGSLAFRYALEITPNGTVSDLADVIDVYAVIEPAAELTGRDSLGTPVGTLSDVISGKTTANGVLHPDGASIDAGEYAGEIILGIALKMREDAGNEYQNKSIGDSFDVTLLATQYTYEEDSFGDDYDTDAELPGLKGDATGSTDVETENGVTTADATITTNTDVKATVPAGVKVEGGKLSLSVTAKEGSDSNITAGEGENLAALDVHIDGVSPDNTTPILVELGAILSEGFNQGNMSLYHVENGTPVPMTQVLTLAELDAHNEYYYDPATGIVTVAMATFSEVALVADTIPAWEGKFDYSWYDASKTELTIANADQLAAFGAIVGGMATTKADANLTADIAQDSFAGKTVKLICDITIGEMNGDNGLVFYPIGYYNSEGTYERTNTAITSGLRNFEGTFDGNGHTVSDFYHNTWEMKGDHDWYSPEEQYYRDGMGLFGRIYKGTVKNLTVRNFQSDGEIATTGVIAAYADGATFENIAIFDCNPRVYNIGNGGIVGCVGWYAKEANLKTTFTNITVDNSNKISALWGSYDVACGGIVGQYYPTSGQSSANYPVNAGIEFVNCHVAAQMDVYNDVCANYQYYAYRYTGMLIGSVRENVTIDGRSYPKMDGITATGCTVHFGTWNDYYYCEIIDNTTASYTHDYQMSRLTEIKAINGTTITYLDDTTGTVPTSGRANYVIVDYTKGHGSENATCYHFKDGEVWTHDMGGIQTGIDENGDGQDDLKEDKQHIYLEFNNLVTGYGWGVTSRGLENLDGVTNLEVTEGDHENSVEKFKKNEAAKDSYTTGTTVTIGELFAAIENAGVDIKGDKVQVTVSPVIGTNSTAGGTYTANTTDWKQGTLTFSGTGDATITITDYYFCKATTIEVEITGAEAFEIKLPNYETYLYRVGNMNEFSIGSLFKLAEGVSAVSNVAVEVKNGDAVMNVYTAGSGAWDSGKINFKTNHEGFTGLVTVTISADNVLPLTLYLEVVDAVNATGATNATANNVVLLNNISGGFTVSDGFAFYGNGFKVTCSGTGYRLNFAGMYGGFIEVNDGGVLDNVQVFCDIYPVALLYSSEAKNYKNEDVSTAEKTYYNYQLSAVAITGNGSMITNSYIYGGRNNIYVGDGNVTIANTTTENGVLANIQIKGSDVSTVTLKDVTTIQSEVTSTYDPTKTMLGCGILVGDNASESNPNLIIQGTWDHYNWVTAANATNTSNSYAKDIITKALSYSEYVHKNSNNTNTVNLGMIVLNQLSMTIDDQRDVKANYKPSKITMSLKDPSTGLSVDVTGQVYSIVSGKGNPNAIAPKYVPTKNLEYKPTAVKDETVGGNKDANDGGNDSRYCYWEGNLLKLMYKENESAFALDVAKLINFRKFGFALNSSAVVTKDGATVNAVNGKVTFTDAGTYVITYTVTDPYNYDKSGNQVANPTTWIFTYNVEVSVVESNGKNAEIKVSSTNFYGSYGSTGGWDPDFHYCIPFMKDVTITDYAEDGITSQLFDVTSNIDDITVVGDKTSGTVTLTYTDGRVLVVTVSGHSVGLGSSGNTISVKSYNGQLWICTDGVSNNATTATWKVTSYKFTGNNGVPVEYTDERTCNFDSSNKTNSPQTSWSSFTNPLDTGSGDSGDSGDGGGSGGCVTPDTLITLADGTQVRVDSLTGNEMLLVWNMETGKLDSAPILFVDSDPEAEFEIVHLYFSDGTDVKVIYEHGFWDYDLNKYVYLDRYADKYIGHTFAKQNGDSLEKVKLVDVVIETEVTTAWSPVTEGHLCYFVNGMLSMPGGVGGLFNIFDVDPDTMTYDYEAMARDIEKYGLFTYEELNAIVPLSEEMFNAAGGAYLKVSIGKGNLTMDELIRMIQRYSVYFD